MFMFFFWTVFIGAVIYLIVKWFDRKARVEIEARNVPYIPLNNAILSVLLKERTEETKDEIIKKTGKKVFGFKMMMSNTILCVEPEIVQQVMITEFTNFVNRRKLKINDPIFKHVLSVVLDDQWKRLRSIVTPTFSSGNLRRMKPRIDETVQNLLNNFEAAVNKSPTVDVKKLFGSFTMDTIVQVAFGTRVDSLNDPQNPLIVRAREVFSRDITPKIFAQMILIMALPKVANALGIRMLGEATDFFRDFSENIIAKAKEDLKQNKPIKATSFIEFVLEAEAEYEKNETAGKTENGVESDVKKSAKFMTTSEMVAQCVLFFLAGYDTTATTITLASYSLALNPEIQDKLYDEIETVLQKLENEPGNEGKSTMELVTLEVLPRFEYLNAVVNETLRLYAPAQVTERTAAKDILLQTKDGRVSIDLKKGDVVHIPIYSLHRDEEHFPEPEIFNPEHFMDEPRFHKCSYLPFGQGSRNCIAKALALMEVKLALLNTVRKYKFSRCDETKVPFESYYQNNFLSPREIILKVEKR